MDFRKFIERYLENEDQVRAIPVFKDLLDKMSAEDKFVSDGYEFSLTFWKTMVLDRPSGSLEEARKDMERISPPVPARVQDEV